jgi:hypothetical protein
MRLGRSSLPLLLAATVGCAMAGEGYEDAGPDGGGGGGVDGALIDAPGTIDAPFAGADAAPADAGGGTGVSCESGVTCFSAASLGSMSGDTGSGVITFSGHQATWVTVRMTENEDGPFARRMRLRAQLDSPPGSNFDLYLYVNPNSDVLECNNVRGSSTNGAGEADIVAIGWGESGTFANGVDDSRTVAIEIRHVSGTCDPNATWFLELRGNTGL